MSNVPSLGSFVAAEFFPPNTVEHESINPSEPKDVIARFGEGTLPEVDRAVDAAQEAWISWRETTGATRADALHRWADAIAGRADELALALCREIGKPIGEAKGEVARCSAILRYYAGEAVRPIGEVIPALAPGAVQFSMRQPLGIAGLVTPWNFPLAIPIWKAAPALAFGNTVVLKPAEASSHAAALLAETSVHAQLPNGVFNVVFGTGPVAGEALCRHPGVAAISFTGSVATGKKVAIWAAERNAKCQTEMGGKNVAIVLEDADLDFAANLVASGAMRYAGQKCTATSRAVVARKVLKPFLAALDARVRALSLGPVTDPSAAVGPLISREAKERTEAVLAGMRELKATSVSVPAELREGFFVSPTVFRDVATDSPLAQDELFAPILAVLSVNDLDEAIAVANDTRYGLSASLFTGDVGGALAYIRRIEAGMVRVNGDTTGVDPHAPFGGVKASSSGSREQGQAAREFYTEIKTVQINPS